MAKSHTFDWMKSEFLDAVKESVLKSNVEPINKLYKTLPDSDTEKKSAVDQGFRDYLVILVGSRPNKTVVWEDFLRRCIDACQLDMATATMPVVLLGDIFDCLTLDQCEQLFTFVEDNVIIWKEELFFTSCKNNLLRMCNDLLRRLSRSQNTVFCGRILLFLAKFFPFSERSGLNIVSEFNIDNVTEFGGEDNTEEEKMDESMEDIDDQKITVDYNLYSKFWSLQNFFRNPILIYNKVHWKTFASHTENVLQAFKSFKLEGVESRLVAGTSGREHYFAKFLTNIKLLELQLSDVNFRRFVLLQFLILFQYLKATVKFKSDSQELQASEADWVEGTTERVYSLLKETPPDGEQFTKDIQHILKREEFWNNWKNDGCPELQKRRIDDSDEKWKPLTKRRRLLGDIIRDTTHHKKFYMGNPELTRLWNFNPDNLESCRTSARDFLMSLEDYFKEAIEQFDPAAMVDEEYKVVKDGNFGWRALRMLALKSTHFFTPSNNPINKLSDYLETMIKKIARERPIILPSGEIKEECETAAEINTVDVNETEAEPEGEAEADEAEEDELLKGDDKRDELNNEERVDTPEMTQKPKISPEILDVVAQTINTQWAELTEKLGYKDSIQYIEESTKTDVARARYVLQLWSEEDASLDPKQLAKVLENHGFSKASSAIIKLM